jgi:hypothetical protein
MVLPSVTISAALRVHPVHFSSFSEREALWAAMVAAVSVRHRTRSVHLCASGSAGEEGPFYGCGIFITQAAHLLLIACEGTVTWLSMLRHFITQDCTECTRWCLPFFMCLTTAHAAPLLVQTYTGVIFAAYGKYAYT